MNLSSGEFKGRIKLIKDHESARQAFRELIFHTIIGFDTEWNRFCPKGVHTIQLSTFDTCYIFQLKKLEIFPSSLKFILESKEICKIGFSVEQDCKRLLDHNVFVQTIFDLQEFISDYQTSISIFRGLNSNKPTPISLKSVCVQYLEFIPFWKEKETTLSRWNQKYLTEKQLNYAASDAWICLHLYSHFYYKLMYNLHYTMKFILH